MWNAFVNVYVLQSTDNGTIQPQPTDAENDSHDVSVCVRVCVSV